MELVSHAFELLANQSEGCDAVPENALSILSCNSSGRAANLVNVYWGSLECTDGASVTFLAPQGTRGGASLGDLLRVLKRRRC